MSEEKWEFYTNEHGEFMVTLNEIWRMNMGCAFDRLMPDDCREIGRFIKDYGCHRWKTTPTLLGSVPDYLARHNEA